MDQKTIHDKALKVLQWAKGQVGSDSDDWQMCNRVSAILAMALWESGITNLEYAECLLVDSESLPLKHEWLRWDRVTIDLTIEQFSRTTSIMAQLGKPRNFEGVRYIFGESQWHDDLKGSEFRPVDESLVKDKSRWLEDAKIAIDGPLPKCQHLKNQRRRKELGIRDS